MDKIIYTGKCSKEEVSEKLNKVISEFLREKADKEEIRVDEN